MWPSRGKQTYTTVADQRAVSVTEQYFQSVEDFTSSLDVLKTCVDAVKAKSEFQLLLGLYIYEQF